MSKNFFFYFFQPEIRMVLAFVTAFVINAYAIPILLRIARAKHLLDMPDERKNHGGAVPTLGGLGIYAAFVITSLTLINTCGVSMGESGCNLFSLPPIVAGFTILMFIGMKDDLIGLPASKKFIAEIIAVGILVVVGDVRLSSMQGMFTVGTLHYYVSVPLSLFAGLVIVNAFNLIDGIDGLASSVAILASVIFGSYFYAAGDWEYAVFAVVLIGAVIPFFMFNAYGKTNKIFMGDTGSLILGFAMTVLVFRFNELNTYRSTHLHLTAAPAFSVAVLIIPLFDTFRVFLVRILRGGSPFKPDRRHIHHMLLDMGFTHLQATSVLLTVNIAFVAIAYFFNFLGNSSLIFLILSGTVLFTGVAVWFHRRALAKLKKTN